MKIDRSSFILALVCTTTLTVHAQEPLTPLWQHVDSYGAGSILCCTDVVSTRLAYDHGTDRIYRSIMVWSLMGAYEIQVFDTDGYDITPPSPVVLQGGGVWDQEASHIIQLSAHNDTLSAIVRYEDYASVTDDLNWLRVLGTSGSPYYLLGTGNVPLNAFHRDALGTLVLTDDELRSLGTTGWPAGSVAIPQAQGMAVLGNDVMLGSPPSLSHFDRNDLTELTPISVPSSGTAISSYCIANGNSAFNYTALNGDGSMDVGLVDLNNGPIWNTTISVPQQARPTAFHVDEQGDFWVAIAHNATGMANLGLLYRFRSTGGPFAVSSFGRRIDGITSSGPRLFLTGRVSGSSQSTYLAAFDVDLITQTSSISGTSFSCYPNPATNEIQLVGLAPGTLRMTITDATGRHVRELQGPFKGSLIVNIADLPSGTYLLRSSGSGAAVTRPFSVVR